jgi:hypothetical protein
MNQPFKVWDSQHQSMTRYTPKKLYKITVVYPITDRELEFIGMDRGSCIMQAEVAKEEDDIMLMRSEEEITVLQKEKI